MRRLTNKQPQTNSGKAIQGAVQDVGGTTLALKAA